MLRLGTVTIGVQRKIGAKLMSRCSMDAQVISTGLTHGPFYTGSA